MGKFILTEEERTRIKLLYEQSVSTDFYWVGKKRYFDFDKKWRVKIEIFDKKNDQSVAGGTEEENSDLKIAYDNVVKKIQKELADKNLKNIKIPTLEELDTEKDENILDELKGKTFNTFEDSQNLSFSSKYTIKNVSKSGGWGALTIWIADTVGDFLIFKCGSDGFELHRMKTYGNYETTKVYSNKLLQYIKGKYCINAGGSPKPKSDFIP